MIKLTTALMSLSLVVGAGAALAESHMDHDAMSKPAMAKDEMAQDAMSKGAMAKDAMEEGAMEKGDMAKDAMQHPDMSDHSHMGKDAMTK